MTAHVMVQTNRRSLLLLSFGALVAACTASPLPQNGICTQDDGVQAGCTGGIDGGTAEAFGLLGYSCTGTARPDDHSTYDQGVPNGAVCANQISPADGGASISPQTYCCTPPNTACAYNPIAICDPGTYGYQCQGADRPESYNPEIICGQGVREGGLIDYCCSGTGLPPGCTEKDSGCPGGLVGWDCPNISTIPKGQDLMANKSRADQYYLLCPIPTPAGQAGHFSYCCYPPALVPPGGTCVQDLTVPNCAPGRFGFACYGRDVPEDDYPPITNCDPGFAGNSGQGYPATLYCCDFE